MNSNPNSVETVLKKNERTFFSNKKKNFVVSIKEKEIRFRLKKSTKNTF